MTIPSTSKLQDLAHYLTDQAYQLPNELDKFECLTLIESWQPVRLALDSLRSGTMSSYTLNGRSVTKISIPTLETQENHLMAQIKDFLWMRGVTLIDMRGFYTNTMPFAGGGNVTV